MSTSNSGNTPAASSTIALDNYLHWAKHDAAIAAPKVAVALAGEERSLVCTDTIYPGERILYLPCSALIGDAMLRATGRQALLLLLREEQMLGQRKDEDNKDAQVSPQEWEQVALGTIEEFRQLLDGNDNGDAAVRQAVDAVQQQGYAYRDDDGVALYLIACRYILQHCSTQEEDSLLSEMNPTRSPESGDAVEPELPLTEATPIDNDDELSSGALVLEPNQVVTSSNTSPTVPSYPSFLNHVAVLPASFPTSPLCFTEEELTRIEGTNCHGYATRMRQQIESDWLQLRAVLQVYTDSTNNSGRRQIVHQELVDIVTLEAYQWALCNIYSRSTDFARRGDAGAKHDRVIAPVFDMMNHDFESDISHAMDTDGALSVFNGSTRAIEPGEELSLCYGSFPNEKLLLIYGFAVPNNPFDVVSIFAPVSPQDPLHSVKTRILETKCGIVDTNGPHSLSNQRLDPGQSILPNSLVSVLRVVGIQSYEEVLALARQETTEVGTIGMISVENETGALTALQHALYSMTRRLALNLISDDTIERAAAMDEAALGIAQGATEQRDRQSSHEPTRNQAQAVADAAKRLQDPNFCNAQILCQSEYVILQRALTELSERLAELDGSSGIQQ